jgi:uncharacterized protein YciU (UPF0263 family)
MNNTVAAKLANLVVAWKNCRESGNAEWEDRHAETIERLVREYLPRGSGFDDGTEIVADRCRSDRLVFTTSFHHMDECGYYDGWTDHVVTVRPDFVHGITVGVVGSNRNDIHDYIADAFVSALMQEVAQ